MSFTLIFLFVLEYTYEIYEPNYVCHVFTNFAKCLSIVLVLYDIFSMKLFDKCFNVLFFILFCDMYADMVEPRVVSKPNNVQPYVHAIDSAEYSVTQKTYQDRDELKREYTCSRKCRCPFRSRDYFKASKIWSLSVVFGLHNHKMEQKLEGHILNGRLNVEEKRSDDEMIRNMV